MQIFLVPSQFLLDKGDSFDLSMDEYRELKEKATGVCVYPHPEMVDRVYLDRNTLSVTSDGVTDFFENCYILSRLEDKETGNILEQTLTKLNWEYTLAMIAGMNSPSGAVVLFAGRGY